MYPTWREVETLNETQLWLLAHWRRMHRERIEWARQARMDGQSGARALIDAAYTRNVLANYKKAWGVA